jgi:hypothetical protein
MPLTNLLPFTPRADSVRIVRTGFETIPADLSKAELFRYFTYSAEDRLEIFACRGSSNKLGFAILLGSVRLTGRFPLHFETLPTSLLDHVCKQLKMTGRLFLDYPNRPATLHEHKERINTYLGLRYFVPEEHPTSVLDFIREQVRAGIPPDELTEQAEEHLRARHFVLPGVTVLQKLVSAALTQAEAELYELLGARLTAAQQQAILALLMIPADQSITPFQQLQQTATRPSPEALARELDHLEQVRALFPATLDLRDMPAALIERWARITSGLPTRNLQRSAPEKSQGSSVWCNPNIRNV